MASSPDNKKPLGIMRPLGGGDPIPLLKEVLLLGRRPKCDIQLDFENVSGKHCELRLIHGVWHVRDMGSTNGTTVNGQKIKHDQGLMPDDELGIASHFYNIDYDPVAPSSLMNANAALEEEVGRTRSLLELAGLEGDSERRRARFRGGGSSSASASSSGSDERPAYRPAPPAPRAPEPPPEDFAAEEPDDRIDGDIPSDFLVAGGAMPSDDDFLSMIEEDLQNRKPKP